MDTQDAYNILGDSRLRIAGAIQESIVDGPGIRYTIFTQGCPFRCKGCHNPQSQPRDGGLEVKLSVLYDEIRQNPLTTGVTFSGGEPFLQAKRLVPLARVIKSDGYSLWSYTGYLFEKLLLIPEARELLNWIDTVVDGPFILEKKSLMLDFRGSSNQRIIDVQASLKQGVTVLNGDYI